MPHVFLSFCLLLAGLLTLGSAQPASADAPPPSVLHMIGAPGHRIAFHVTPGHAPILLFDAGGGLDSSYWNPILAEIEAHTGSELITYDRAGFGQSDDLKTPYRIEDSVADLQAGLEQLHATKDVIIVAHSFGGEVDTFLAVKHPGWFAGAVLVDASMPNFFTDAETERLFKQMPNIPKDNKYDRSMAAVIAAWPVYNHEFHEAVWPAQIPCIVIVSEKSPFPAPQDAALWHSAHAAFAQGAPNRQLVFAKGSSHDVVSDRPDLIIQAVSTMVQKART